MAKVPSRAFLLASLKLWERRLKYRRSRVDHWNKRHNQARVAKWRKLVREAEYWVSHRRRQLASGARKGSFGVDWSRGQPNIGELKAANVRFVCRYLSRDASKNLTASQAKALSKAGIDCVVVWETTADRALAGFKAGAQDATDAIRQARLCGFPSTATIYFAVDFDESPEQAKRVAEYFQGVHSVLDTVGPADMPHPVGVGVYGGYWTVKRLLDAKLVDRAWQTYAWSGGKWDGRAHIRQTENGKKLAGVDCDFNLAMADDFGQWRA